jgi:hypothetical protein
MLHDGTVQSAPVGSLGFDVNAVLTSEFAQGFVAQGFKFCLRYISRGIEVGTDLTSTEAEHILNTGLALMPVQHVRRPGWIPSAAIGTQDGQHAANNASTIGFPVGVNVWCDLEGVALGTSAQAVIEYCNAWLEAVNAAGYLPGLYVGFQTLLNEQQLFQLKFQHYWRSQSNVPNLGKRGYQMIQLFPEIQVNGLKVDVDITQTDYKGGGPQWLIRTNNRPRG